MSIQLVLLDDSTHNASAHGIVYQVDIVYIDAGVIGILQPRGISKKRSVASWLTI